MLDLLTKREVLQQCATLQLDRRFANYDINCVAVLIRRPERMAEYYSDKTMHLGKELRELAARKALQINLAMKFIEENCKSRQ